MSRFPQLRITVGQFEIPPEFKGKWTYEIRLCLFGTEQDAPVIQGAVFDHKSEAVSVAQTVAQSIARQASFQLAVDPALYRDLHTNAIRTWSEH